MTVKYDYKCETCGHDYAEQRGAQQEAFFTTCNRGDGGSYVLVKETVLAPDIEVVAAGDSPASDYQTGLPAGLQAQLP